MTAICACFSIIRNPPKAPHPSPFGRRVTTRDYSSITNVAVQTLSQDWPDIKRKLCPACLETEDTKLIRREKNKSDDNDDEGAMETRWLVALEMYI